MKVLIVGAGETGYYIASEFTSGKYEVSVIDDNHKQLTHVQKSLNVAGFSGNGTSISVLETAGIEETDLLIACTDHDETNLISCLLANQYNVKQKIAITKTNIFREKDVIDKYLQSGVDMIINSSLVVSQEIMEVCNLAVATEVSSFAEKSVLLVGYKVKADSPLADKQLQEIVQPDDRSKFLIACIVRGETSHIPSGKDLIRSGDYIYLMISRKQSSILNQFLNVKISKSRKVIIAGDGMVGEILAEKLTKEHFSTTLISQNPLEVQRLNKKYSRKDFQAVYGDPSEVKLQLKLDVPLSSMFIAVDKDDHTNIAAGMVAAYLGSKKIIAQVNHRDLLHIPEMVGIDVVISPRLVTARKVKKMIRGGEKSLDFTTISETNMEVIEMVANKNSKITGIPLKELVLPKGVLVGAIVDKQKKVVIPSGETKIEIGDKVIILSMPENVDTITEMIEGEIRLSPLSIS